MIFKDYYAILDILPQASQNEVMLAYKDMAKKWHPDINKGENTTEKMQLIIEAYHILKDTDKRKVYNLDYYKFYQIKVSFQSKRSSKLEKCFYCDGNTAKDKYSHKVTLYKEIKRIYFPQRKIWYKIVNVDIPRCEQCYNIHNKNSKIFMYFPFIGFSLLGFILGLTIWNLWIVCTIAGALVGRIIGEVFSSIDKSIISKESRIKSESDYSGYKIINKMCMEEWVLNKPIA